MKRIFAWLLLPLLLLSGCCTAPKRFQTQFFDLFDTVTTFTSYASSQEEFQARADRVYSLLKEYHQLCDIYHEYPGRNNLKTINDRGSVEPVQTDERLIQLLIFSREMYQETEQQMNPAMGSVLELWHACREAGTIHPEQAVLPDPAALEQAAEHMDFSHVWIDPEASTVFLEDPALRLDLSAVAKGYAAEQAALLLEAEGCAGLLNLGGNVRTVGRRPDAPWQVGVQDPFQPEELLEALPLEDASLVTSGTYQRYYVVDGVRYHHLIDPDTLMPGRDYASVTVRCRDSGRGDALSSGLFCLSLEEGLRLVEGLPDTEALWILPDGSRVSSSGWQGL